MKSDVHFTSKSDEWATPIHVFNKLDEVFHFTLDPCSSDENAKCKKHYTKADDGLSKSWDNEIVFMNPPYSNASGWMKKAFESKGTVVCLVPSRTDTRWWHDYAMRGNILFIKGRLKFGDSKNSAPFPSAIIIFDRDNFLDTTGATKCSTYLQHNEKEIEVVEI